MILAPPFRRSPLQHSVESILDEVLRSLRIEGAAPYELTLREPWGVGIPGHAGIIACYLLREGRCWFTVGGDEVGWVEEGDVLISLGGLSYTMQSSPREPIVPFVKRAPPGGSCDWRKSRAVRFGGRGQVSRSLLMTLRTDRTRTNPLLLAEPGWFRLKGVLHAESSPLARSLALLDAELRFAEAGFDAVIDRLGEIVLAQVLRQSLCELQKDGCGATGWLRGVAEPAIGRVLYRIHREPEADWTVAQLASVAAMSRTGFALRFAELMGLPPLAYLRRIRIDRASELLRREDATVAQIAARVGYASEAAFCRAFKREVGLTPREWRSSDSASPG